MAVPSRAVEADLELMASALGSQPCSLERVSTGGYTRSLSWRAGTDDGPAFVKQAEDEGSLHMLRREALVYQHVRAPFLPGYVGFADGGERAVLAIEYLDQASWPPPWPTNVSPLFEALEQVRATPPPDVPRWPPWRSRWAEVAAAPGPFLALGLCSASWFDAALDRLLEAEARVEWTGEAFTHSDVYSGNVAFVGRRAVLVDWGVASLGSPWLDTAFALLSLRSEGGPCPEMDLPDEDAFAAALAGHCAIEAPRPLPDWADPDSSLRADMAQDLAAGLAWCVEALDLPPLR